MELTFAEVFQRAVREAQPDADPVLTKGDGVTPNAGMDVDSAILSARRTVTWASGASLRYGQIVRPATPNGLEYQVVTPGVAGATEPDWNAGRGGWGSSSGGRIYDNTAVLEQYGADSGEFDVNLAMGRVLQLKADRLGDRMDYSADAVTYKETGPRQYWQERADAYLKTGAAMIA
jgi:hypothetical protein